MQIGYFCYFLSGTGPRTRARNIINAVAERSEHDVTVLTHQPRLVSDEAEVHEISLRDPGSTALVTRRAFSGMDVAHVPINIFQVLFVRLFYRGPLVAGVGPGIQPARQYRALGRLLGIDRKVIVHEHQTGWEESGYDTAVVTATIDRDEFYPYDDDRRADVRSEFGLPADANVVLYVGKLRESKGAHIVDRMAHRAADDDFRFVVIGDGPLEDHFEVCEYVRYEGFVDNNAMPKYYNAAAVTVGPRKRDNTSNVGLESIACGTPYVTTADGHIRTLFEDRGSYVWADRDPESVLAAVRDLLSDPGRYDEQVARGLETFEEMSLTLEDALATHLELYDELGP